eukprot:TRINITY_DN19888_c0_g1_i1.p3 TRINITY_DN19888_c0_g1~~TRINITY_DN19888_c0_g1_i1.p3  ORF type:complete len:107 (-),score=17.31 TRINITY_DN19888_c0_g1_i1:448-768(-)
MNPAASGVQRTSRQLYRDCLRLANHVGGRSAKGDAMRKMISTEFRKHIGETDPARVAILKAAAVRGLSNYFLHESASRDAKLKARMEDQRIAVQAEIGEEQRARKP